jgi:hypothetical protein
VWLRKGQRHRRALVHKLLQRFHAIVQPDLFGDLSVLEQLSFVGQRVEGSEAGSA